MSEAVLSQVSGPVLRARRRGDFFINEAVAIGERRLLGEVIRIEGEEIVVQVYEDTSGLRPGVPVIGSEMPLAIRVGPALLGRIFDGLLRPLSMDIGHYVRPGLAELAPRTFHFEPRVEVGHVIPHGGVFGRIVADSAREQHALLAPDIGGRVVSIAPAGDIRDDEMVCELETESGVRHKAALSHYWSVRKGRPVAERLPAEKPLLTGQRILDSLFPVARGGKAALPGGFGTGKTVLQESLAKWCDADVIVYVGCGERGNEMAGVLHEFPELEDPRTGRPLMERTVIIANTSNMPVAAREASIYTGLTVAEYFRDQGLHVALMADSTSRWAEALREVSGRLGELPGEGGYPAYLSSRLADFYERAARVTTLGGDEGSLTLIGAVSPPSGDFSEPVTTHTKRYVRCFWALDRSRAQSRFFPAVHPLTSYSEDVEDLTPWWEREGNTEWPRIRRRFLTLVEQQAHIERMARIIGKDALPPKQRLTLLAAELVSDGFLRQSSFSPTDRYCSPARQTAMMRLIDHFITLADNAVERGIDVERIQKMSILRRLRRMGEELGDDQLARYKLLGTRLEAEFAHLVREAGHAG
ncbi:V-type ATP synthase subunit A [Thiohalomonas denitrificans]|uniref:V-type ATP synthase alpha chain n=1 Tax=Thiohalomonas denitrificans TaxID=415747 RepID=A0A1G5PM55_9GAMM|nr:V-type ATP synthase subunit A [Thiohalomonas denitrificans]SCZ50230.1 V/A-type H+-transporting ATPase subunit A [Thiohalomonas denitrificans]